VSRLSFVPSFCSTAQSFVSVHCSAYIAGSDGATCVANSGVTFRH